MIYISHRLEEIFEIADRVQVMRDGQMISNRDMADVTRELLIEDMVGRTIDKEFPRESRQPGPEKLRVEGLCQGEKVRDVSFRVCCGEVLGITGLVGSGRTEMARIIFGADRAQRGQIFLDGKPIRTESPRQAIRQGICLLTEDRKSQGLVLKHSVLENFALPNLNAFSRWNCISSRAGTVEVREALPESEDPPGNTQAEGRHVVRRKSAEGCAGEVAGSRLASHHLRRTHARHRRRRQIRYLSVDQRIGPSRESDRDHQFGTSRDSGNVRPHLWSCMKDV